MLIGAGAVNFVVLGRKCHINSVRPGKFYNSLKPRMVQLELKSPYISVSVIR